MYLSMKSITVENLSLDYSKTEETAIFGEDKRAQELLKEFGCFVAKGLLNNGELDFVRNDIKQLIEMRMRKVGLQKNSPKDDIPQFDDGFLQLRMLEYAYAKELLAKGEFEELQSLQLEHAHCEVIANVCRMLMSVNQINVNPKLVNLSKKLMLTNTLMSHSVFDIRVDYPYDDDSLFPWHQDYPVIQDSEDALIYWIPLRDVGEQDGCLTVAPGSHKLGVLPQHPQSYHDVPSTKIPDLSILTQFPHISVPMQAGDVLAFSTLLLHASGTNRSENVRWTLQVRHGNFEHQKAIARNWTSHGVWNVPFEVSHPEYTIPWTEVTN
jgi:Phytanoyl-CoA dioxygenase (PhyH)